MIRPGSFRANAITVMAFAVCFFSAGAQAQNTLTLKVDSAKYKIERAIYPAHSAVMLSLTPPVGVIPNVKSKTIDKLSIKPEIGGRVEVTGLVSQKMPVHLIMFSTNGQIVSETIVQGKTAGTDRYEWQPAVRCEGVYVVKLQSGGDSEFRRINVFR